jgi:hypothetical protein
MAASTRRTSRVTADSDGLREESIFEAILRSDAATCEGLMPGMAEKESENGGGRARGGVPAGGGNRMSEFHAVTAEVLGGWLEGRGFRRTVQRAERLHPELAHELVLEVMAS